MSNGRLRFGHELFLDRTHGKRMGEMLRRVGFTVHPIYEVYTGTAHESVSDPEWIGLCGSNGWIVVSGDKRLETVPVNRQAIIKAKAKAFILNDSSSRPEIWAAAIIIGHYRMLEIIDANDGPFFVTVGKRSDQHVARLRLPSGFTPIAPEQTSDGIPIPMLKLTSPGDSSEG